MASLKGIRVLEMAQIMAGPTCGLLLADLGAEVIKIEKTPGGDDTRNFLPPDVNGISAAYLMMNRNKKGIVLKISIPSLSFKFKAIPFLFLFIIK